METPKDIYSNEREQQSESIEIQKKPEEIEAINKATIVENTSRVDASTKEIERTQTELSRVRAELGIPDSTEIPPSIQNEQQVIERAETENEALAANEESPLEKQEGSPEMKKFKAEVADLTETVAQFKFQLAQRTEYGFSEFFREEDTEKLTGTLSALSSLDVYTDHNLDTTKKLIGDLTQFVDSLETRPRNGGTNDDPESLGIFTQKMADISDKASGLEATGKQLDSDNGIEVARLSNELANIAKQAAFFLDKKRQALEEYFR